MYNVEVVFSGIMFIPNFVKIGQLFQKLKGENTYTGWGSYKLTFYPKKGK
jgi:hypothetical protein